jgi:hypothetical protein
VGVGVACIGSSAVKRALVILGYVIGVYLVFRAIAELVLIDYGDASSYRDDWGGPSLAGVLAIHVLPIGAAAVLVVRNWQRHKHKPGARVEPRSIAIVPLARTRSPPVPRLERVRAAVRVAGHDARRQDSNVRRVRLLARPPRRARAHRADVATGVRHRGGEFGMWRHRSSNADPSGASPCTPRHSGRPRSR